MTARLPKDSINPQMQMVTKIFPVFFGFISLSVPAGVVLYFVVSNLWQIGQQAVAFRNREPVPWPRTSPNAQARQVGGEGGGAADRPPRVADRAPRVGGRARVVARAPKGGGGTGKGGGAEPKGWWRRPRAVRSAEGRRRRPKAAGARRRAAANPAAEWTGDAQGWRQAQWKGHAQGRAGGRRDQPGAGQKGGKADSGSTASRIAASGRRIGRRRATASPCGAACPR